MEKWTGRGGSVGNAQISQTLIGLEPGCYELTAGAQNIQEDTPTAAQTGACIFAGDEQEAVSATDDYSVRFAVIDGTVTIGFKAEKASGNWIAVDNFRLKKVEGDLSQKLAEALTSAQNLYGDGSGRAGDLLKSAIDAAKATAADASATVQQQADAILALQAAEEEYRLSNASEEQPLDMTSLIVNPSFEIDGSSGWNNMNMQSQSNNVFNIKQGNTYMEKWVSKGNNVGDASLSQVVSNLPLGQYRLRVAAQNIQENSPNAKQSGAWIFADDAMAEVTVRGQYTLDFTVVSGSVTIGFRAEGAKGNWIAVDNFRLEYIGNGFDQLKAELQRLVDEGNALLGEQMNAQVKDALEKALAVAQPLLSQSSAEGYDDVSASLIESIGNAKASIEAYALLKEAIDVAQGVYDSSSSENKSTLATAIAEAQALYDSLSSSNEALADAVAALDVAMFAFRIENGTGAVPTVTTDTRYARGATLAFGRSTIKTNGATLLEQGFCWSENPDPKVTDHRTTDYFNVNGRIYRMKGLKPATVYYVRAYALTTNYAVGYGDVIKIITLPKGTVSWWYNNGADADANARINSALATAVDYWNDLTNITGFGVSCSYGSGTPTADCGYGGGMRVGPNASYQRAGTIMHEMLHGIGVGTHYMWTGYSVLRENGYSGLWLGDRVTQVLRFWDNNNTSMLTGDGTHMWPYGINGAQEDNGSPELYTITSLLAQALGEDGLPCSGSRGFASPAYVFEQQDDVKYYIKNEDENLGRYNSYLVENESHQLVWKKMSAEEAQKDDAAAWYISFTPSNQYYQLRNAASGYYMTYSSGFKTMKHSQPTAADNFHFMRSRIDVTLNTGNGTASYRGYWMIHPESNSTPPCLTASANGATKSSGFDIANTATSQRWLLLTASEAVAFEEGCLGVAKKEFEDMLAKVRELSETPHVENVADADNTLEASLSELESKASDAGSASEVSELTDNARAAGMTFLESVSPSDASKPFDLTFLMINPDFEKDSSTGWTTSVKPGYNYESNEFYETNFNFYQTLTSMPKGTYELRAQAFTRPGRTETVYQDFIGGTDKSFAKIYLQSTSKGVPVKNIMADRQPVQLYSGSGTDLQLADNTYVPNSMAGAAEYFKRGLYDNSVIQEVGSSGANLVMGISGTNATSYYWCFFDHFRIYYYGSLSVQDITAINEIAEDSPSTLHASRSTLHTSFFTLQGLNMGDRFDTLPPGIYVRNGKKIIKR